MMATSSSPLYDTQQVSPSGPFVDQYGFEPSEAMVGSKVSRSTIAA